MQEILFNLVTAALMVLLVKSGAALVGIESAADARSRRFPWAAAVLVGIAVAGVALQLAWPGAMAALDDDPARSGWWRPATAVFLQNGGVVGVLFNLVTLALLAALAHWYWGGLLTLGLFVAGFLAPQYIGELIGQTGGSNDPRNFVGSSGATYFLGATLAAALLVQALRRAAYRDALLAASVPALGLITWFAQENGHGLVAVYGFVLGAALAGLMVAAGRDRLVCAGESPR
jgi:hypothetical protein